MSQELTITEKTRKELSQVLSKAVGENLNVSKIEALTEGGSNAQRHIKLIMDDGTVFSLKDSRLGLIGVYREFLAAQMASRLRLSGSGRSAIIDVPGDISMIGGRECVLLEWLPGADKLENIPLAPESMRNAETARQLGGWCTLVAHLGIGDRNLGNWIWSEKGRIFAAIDFEVWNENSRNLQGKLPGVVKRVLGSKISTELRESFQKGVEDAMADAKSQADVLKSLFEAKKEVYNPSLIDESPEDFTKNMCG